jgi:hypothetical protein
VPLAVAAIRSPFAVTVDAGMPDDPVVAAAIVMVSPASFGVIVTLLPATNAEAMVSRTTSGSVAPARPRSPRW